MSNPYKQLTLVERYQSQSLCELDFSARRIGKRMQHSNKTISGELKRCPPNKYNADDAHLDSLRKRKEAAKFHKRTDAVSQQIKMQLSSGFTPEQITGRMTERVSKLLMTVRVKNKTKKMATRAIIKILKPYRSICKTITFDNGGEFAGHEKIARALSCNIYFAKPYHSWQRGLNENTNGLLRRLFPKGMKIGSLSINKINEAQVLINMRPRKGLNYLNPIEFLLGKRVSLMMEI